MGIKSIVRRIEHVRDRKIRAANARVDRLLEVERKRYETDDHYAAEVSRAAAKQRQAEAAKQMKSSEVVSSFMNW